MKTTPEMRARLRELSDVNGKDDYDRCVLHLLDDSEALLADLRAAEAERDGLREEIGGALHDMGKDGHSICNYSKALLRLAYGDDPENELEYTLAEATASVISSDEMHGKRSPLRDRAALQSTSAKEGAKT